MTTKEIYFAGGCFWGVEHYFRQVRGVINTEVGYANGHTIAPTYDEVYTDVTGHAETVRVEYDPEIVSLTMLVELFYDAIDPLSLNRQGDDFGTRYRTGVYYVSEDDVSIINSVHRRVTEAVGEILAVEVRPLENFYSAEEYHQDYLGKNPSGYCHLDRALMLKAYHANR